MSELNELKEKAEARFAEALAASGARDPREHYRKMLLTLRQSQSERYAEAVEYYESTLLPEIADGGADPLAAWRSYGLLIAELTAPGEAVAVNPQGRQRPFEELGEEADMILHFPHNQRARVLLVGLPTKLSGPQMATYSFLVAGRKKLPEGAVTVS